MMGHAARSWKKDGMPMPLTAGGPAPPQGRTKIREIIGGKP